MQITHCIVQNNITEKVESSIFGIFIIYPNLDLAHL
jgi:hypothetical protein